MEKFFVSLTVSEAASNYAFWSKYDELLTSRGPALFSNHLNEHTLIKETVVACQSEDDYFNLLDKVTAIFKKTASASKTFRMSTFYKPMELLTLYAPSPQNPDSLCEVAYHWISKSNRKDSLEASFKWLSHQIDDIYQKLQDLSDPSLKIEILK